MIRNIPFSGKKNKLLYATIRNRITDPFLPLKESTKGLKKN